MMNSPSLTVAPDASGSPPPAPASHRAVFLLNSILALTFWLSYIHRLWPAALPQWPAWLSPGALLIAYAACLGLSFLAVRWWVAWLLVKFVVFPLCLFDVVEIFFRLAAVAWAWTQRPLVMSLVVIAMVFVVTHIYFGAAETPMAIGLGVLTTLFALGVTRLVFYPLEGVTAFARRFLANFEAHVRRHITAVAAAAGSETRNAVMVGELGPYYHFIRSVQIQLPRIKERSLIFLVQAFVPFVLFNMLLMNLTFATSFWALHQQNPADFPNVKSFLDAFYLSGTMLFGLGDVGAFSAAAKVCVLLQVACMLYIAILAVSGMQGLTQEAMSDEIDELAPMADQARRDVLQLALEFGGTEADLEKSTRISWHLVARLLSAGCRRPAGTGG